MKNYPSLPISRTGLNQARGFSLLEVLVALLVISFGMLGIAGMQALSISNTSVAGYRSIAAIQANSLASAMSANEAWWNLSKATSCTTVVGTTGTGTITLTTPVTFGAGTCGGGLPAPTTDCTASVCSAKRMAEWDLQVWGATLARVLPGGNGAVNCTYTANQPMTCQIVIYWIEKSLVKNQVAGVAATAGTTYDYEIVVQP